MQMTFVISSGAECVSEQAGIDVQQMTYNPTCRTWIPLDRSHWERVISKCAESYNPHLPLLDTSERNRRLRNDTSVRADL